MAHLGQDARRRETADAAIRLIAREGIGVASLRRIAQEADVSMATLAHAFPSKAELFGHAIEQSAEMLHDLVRQIGAQPWDSLSDLVAALLIGFVEGVSPRDAASAEHWSAYEYAQRAQFELFLWALREPRQRSLAYADTASITDSIQKVYEIYAASEPRDIDTRFLAETTSAIADGLILQAMAGSSTDGLGERAATLGAALVDASARSGRVRSN